MSYTVETIDVKINIDAATVAQAIQGVKARLQEIPRKMDVQINPIMAQIGKINQQAKIRVDADISPMTERINNYLGRTHNIRVSASIGQGASELQAMGACARDAQAPIQSVIATLKQLDREAAQVSRRVQTLNRQLAALRSSATSAQSAVRRLTTAERQHTTAMRSNSTATRQHTTATRQNTTAMRQNVAAAQQQAAAVQRNSVQHQGLRGSLASVVTQSTLLGVAIQQGINLAQRMTQSIVSMGLSGIEAAMDLQEARGLFKVTFDGIEADAEAAVQRITNIFPTLEGTIKQEMGLFANNLDGVGFAPDMALSLSETFSALARDMGSFTNVDASRYFYALTGAINGETMALANLGISTKENALNHELMILGLDTTSQKLDDYDKALLRTIVILQNTRKGQNDFARTMNSPSNTLVRMKSTLESISTHIGNVLLPVVANLFSYVEPMLAKIDGWLSKIDEKYGYKDNDDDGESDSANPLTAEEHMAEVLKRANENINKKKKKTAADINKKDEDTAKKVKNLLLSIDSINKLASAASSGEDGEDDEPQYTDLLEEIVNIMQKDYQKKLKDAQKEKEKQEKINAPFKRTSKKDDAEVIKKANKEGRAYLTKDDMVQVLDSEGKKQADTIRGYIDRIMHGNKNNSPLKEEKVQERNERERRDALSIARNYKPADNVEINSDISDLTPLRVANNAVEKAYDARNSQMLSKMFDFASGVEVVSRKVMAASSFGLYERLLENNAKKKRRNGEDEDYVKIYEDVEAAPIMSKIINFVYGKLDDRLLAAKQNAGEVRDSLRGTPAGFISAKEQPVSSEALERIRIREQEKAMDNTPLVGGLKSFGESLQNQRGLLGRTMQAASGIMNFANDYIKQIKQGSDASTKAAANMEKAAQDIKDSKQEVEVTITCDTDLLAAQVQQKMASSNVKRGKSTTYSYGTFGSQRWGYNR